MRTRCRRPSRGHVEHIGGLDLPCSSLGLREQSRAVPAVPQANGLVYATDVSHERRRVDTHQDRRRA